MYNGDLTGRAPQAKWWKNRGKMESFHVGPQAKWWKTGVKWELSGRAPRGKKQKCPSSLAQSEEERVMSVRHILPQTSSLGGPSYKASVLWSLDAVMCCVAVCYHKYMDA